MRVNNTTTGPHYSNWKLVSGVERERRDKMMISNGIEDEEKWLAEGIAGIQHNAFYLHRALVYSDLILFAFQ